MSIISKVSDTTPVRRLIETYKGAYRLLLMEGVKISPLAISYDHVLRDILPEHHKDDIIRKMNEIVERENRDLDIPTDTVRAQLIHPNCVNIAGFTDFTLHDAFSDELKRFANDGNINLNLQIFKKHNKKNLQYYLAQCQDIADLPDILIGKGFSSLMTRKFIDTFVVPGHFDSALPVNYSKLWNVSGLSDSKNQYHAFGAEELVVLKDNSKAIEMPTLCCWSDFLKPEYAQTVTLMGKPQRDHFGASLQFYLFEQFGEQGIRDFARAVRFKWHFSKIMKDIGKDHDESSPYSIVHKHVAMFGRNEADTTELAMEDGNPVTSFFCLVKKGSNPEVIKMASHLFSVQIAQILENSGIMSSRADSRLASQVNIRWIGWDTIRSSSLPYLKDELSEIAYSVFDNNKTHSNDN